MNSRDKILNRIAEALKTKTESASDGGELERSISIARGSITPAGSDGLWNQFKAELEKISGEFYSVHSVDDAAGLINSLLNEMKINSAAIDNTADAAGAAQLLGKKGIKITAALELEAADRKNVIAGMNASVVSPSFAVADIASLVFAMDDTGTSYPHFLCDNTFAIVRKGSITADQFELFERINPAKAKNMFFVTGPSRTADIEKVLVLGAHGPRRLIVIAVD